jgi:hypothetical protein
MVSAQGINCELRPLTEAQTSELSAQLGVYEIVEGGQTRCIGKAGGNERFGMRSALATEAQRWPNASFRHEFTHAYMTRWHELLMLHAALHGSVPEANAGDAHRIGRLS